MKVALIQMNSNYDKAGNLARALSMCAEAAAEGSEFVLLPEMFLIRGDNLDLDEKREPVPGPSLKKIMELAKEKEIWILAGSICEKIEGDTKVYNTSALIDDKGEIVAAYRKIHMFDVDINGTKIQESDYYAAGKSSVLVKVKGVETGLAICFDLRFPELFEDYRKHGAKILCLPAAFTSFTGRMHWEVLLRARAIENQCFVLAPNQTGTGQKQVATYGNSMAVDPWGKVIARASEFEEEIVYAELDFKVLDNVRKRIPVKH